MSLEQFSKPNLAYPFFKLKSNQNWKKISFYISVLIRFYSGFGTQFTETNQKAFWVPYSVFYSLISSQFKISQSKVLGVIFHPLTDRAMMNTMFLLFTFLETPCSFNKGILCSVFFSSFYLTTLRSSFFSFNIQKKTNVKTKNQGGDKPKQFFFVLVVVCLLLALSLTFLLFSKTIVEAVLLLLFFTLLCFFSVSQKLKQKKYILRKENNRDKQRLFPFLGRDFGKKKKSVWRWNPRERKENTTTMGGEGNRGGSPVTFFVPPPTAIVLTDRFPRSFFCAAYFAKKTDEEISSSSSLFDQLTKKLKPSSVALF